MKFEKVFTKVDLAARWGVSRQVVNNWSARRSDFPDPIQFVSNGSIPIYAESDILKYEKLRGVSENANSDN